eukprot:scaffold7052_cov254-Pinguiococcus_pyrenoidosus.AAC.82
MSRQASAAFGSSKAAADEDESTENDKSTQSEGRLRAASDPAESMIPVRSILRISSSSSPPIPASLPLPPKIDSAIVGLHEVLVKRHISTSGLAISRRRLSIPWYPFFDQRPHQGLSASAKNSDPRAAAAAAEAAVEASTALLYTTCASQTTPRRTMRFSNLQVLSARNASLGHGPGISRRHGLIGSLPRRIEKQRLRREEVQASKDVALRTRSKPVPTQAQAGEAQVFLLQKLRQGVERDLETCCRVGGDAYPARQKLDRAARARDLLHDDPIAKRLVRCSDRLFRAGFQTRGVEGCGQAQPQMSPMRPESRLGPSYCKRPRYPHSLLLCVSRHDALGSRRCWMHSCAQPLKKSIFCTTVPHVVSPPLRLGIARAVARDQRPGKQVRRRLGSPCGGPARLRFLLSPVVRLRLGRQRGLAGVSSHVREAILLCFGSLCRLGNLKRREPLCIHAGEQAEHGLPRLCLQNGFGGLLLLEDGAPVQQSVAVDSRIPSHASAKHFPQRFGVVGADQLHAMHVKHLAALVVLQKIQRHAAAGVRDGRIRTGSQKRPKTVNLRARADHMQECGAAGVHRAAEYCTRAAIFGQLAQHLGHDIRPVAFHGQQKRIQGRFGRAHAV